MLVTHPTWRYRPLQVANKQCGSVVASERASMACKTELKAGSTISLQAIKLALPVRGPIERRARSGARARGIIQLLLGMYSGCYVTYITTARIAVLVLRVRQPRPACMRDSETAICDI
jgi:hypothetical protein